MQRQLPRIRPITRSHQDAREGAGRMCESKTRPQIASSVGESIGMGGRSKRKGDKFGLPLAKRCITD